MSECGLNAGSERMNAIELTNLTRVYDRPVVDHLNLTIGESQPYRLALRTRPGTPLVLCRPEYSDVPLPAEYDAQGVAHVTLPPLAAWSTATVRPAKK